MSETKPAPEWLLSVAHEIADEYAVGYDPAAEHRVARLLSERCHDPEKVAKLMEVVELVMTSHAPHWDDLRAALAGLKEGKNG